MFPLSPVMDCVQAAQAFVFSHFFIEVIIYFSLCLTFFIVLLAKKWDSVLVDVDSVMTAYVLF